MPAIYLSPSTQDWNQYVTGSGSEEYNMNLLADELETYLRANAIWFRRNRPEMTAASSVREANAGNYDLYLALHSNAAPDGHYGEERGIIAFYYPGSAQGRRAAELLVRQLRQIYPLPNKVTVRETTSLGEVSRSRAPAVLLEIGYHDNYADAVWVEGHMEDIARQIARGIAEFFGLPFAEPVRPGEGRVSVSYGTLNLRNYPSSEGAIIARMPNDARVTVYGQWQGWYTLRYGDFLGYAAAAYIDR